MVIPLNDSTLALYRRAIEVYENNKVIVDGKGILINGKKAIELAPGEIVITSKDEIFLKKVIQIVEEKMADADFNIDTVAAMVNMGRTSFFGKFKSLTQMAPVEFVREMRLKRAKQYFDAGSDNSANITEVAYTVGFNNAKYFR